MGINLEDDYCSVRNQILKEYGSLGAQSYIEIIDMRLHKWLEIYLPYSVKMISEYSFDINRQTYYNSDKYFNERLNWCEDNIEGKFLLGVNFFSYYSNIAYFQFENDVLHFKLVWG